MGEIGFVGTSEARGCAPISIQFYVYGLNCIKMS